MLRLGCMAGQDCVGQLVIVGFPLAVFLLVGRTLIARLYTQDPSLVASY